LAHLHRLAAAGIDRAAHHLGFHPEEQPSRAGPGYRSAGQGRPRVALPVHAAAADHRADDHDWQWLRLVPVRQAAGGPWGHRHRMDGDPGQRPFADRLDPAYPGGGPRRHGPAASAGEEGRRAAAHAVTPSAPVPRPHFGGAVRSDQRLSETPAGDNNAGYPDTMRCPPWLPVCWPCLTILPPCSTTYP